MNPCFLVLVALSFSFQPAEAKSVSQQDRYAVYWLTKTDGKDEYRMLLITRMPLPELAKLMKLHAELENVLKNAPAPQLLERPALTIATYKKDSIWNDGVPLKPLTRFKDLNEKERTLEVNGVRHHYEECPLADVVRLLKSPEGKEPIHRLFPPLGGMEQTARALRLLIEEQMRDETKLPLPGGNTPLPELAKACKGALVATLQEVGAPELGPPGAVDYASKWKVERVLRGDYPKTTDLSFRVQSVPKKSRENAPAIGKTYVLITHEANAGQIAAILEANEKNLRLIQDLLRR
jgi:hypothetical protein